MSYSVLILDNNSRNMSLNVLRKIKNPAEAGAIIAGPKPLRSPALSDDATEFQSIVSDLWKRKMVRTLSEKVKSSQVKQLPKFCLP
jgi:hypothetical protein